MIQRRSFLKKVALTLPVIPQIGNNTVQAQNNPFDKNYKIKLSLNVYSFNSMLTSNEITLNEVIDFCSGCGFDASLLWCYRVRQIRD